MKTNYPKPTHFVQPGVFEILRFLTNKTTILAFEIDNPVCFLSDRGSGMTIDTEGVVGCMSRFVRRLKKQNLLLGFHIPPCVVLNRSHSCSFTIYYHFFGVFLPLILRFSFSDRKVSFLVLV